MLPTDFPLADSVGPSDPVQQCWQWKPHKAHAWARLRGRDLYPFTCLGIQEPQWQFPLLTEREMLNHYRYGMLINDPKPYSITIITND